MGRDSGKHDDNMTTFCLSLFSLSLIYFFGPACLESAITSTLSTNSVAIANLLSLSLSLCFGFLAREGMRGVDEAEIDRLPIDLLAHIFALISCFKDLAQASGVCKKWKQAVKQSLARRERLSFAGWKMDDDSITRLVLLAYNLKELDISRGRWGCQITDIGLFQISSAKCISNLISISLWGMTGITDEGVVQLISRTASLQHLNIGGTFITDESLFAIADSCPHLKTIVLWSCRHVTGSGLLVLVNKCPKLESINVWGTRVPLECFITLLTVSPALQIKPKGLGMLPVL